MRTHREDREDHDLKALDGAAPGVDGAAKRGRPSGGGGGGGGGGSGGGEGPVTVGRRVYVNNLAPETGWQALKDHFKQAAPVVHAAILAVRRCVTCTASTQGAGSSGGCLMNEVIVTVPHSLHAPAARAVRGRQQQGVRHRGVQQPGRRHARHLAALQLGAPHLKCRMLGGCNWHVHGERAACTALQTLDGKTIFVREDREDNALRGSKGRSPRAGDAPSSFRSGGRSGGGPREGAPAPDGTKVGRAWWKAALHATPLREFQHCAGQTGVACKPAGSQYIGQRETMCVLPQIVVHGLPWSVEWQDLKDLAKQHGDVVKADVVKRSDGKSRGFGTIVFKTPEDAQQAIQACAPGPPMRASSDTPMPDLGHGFSAAQELNGLEFQGRTLSAKVDEFA
jgi:RNA recognition motif-containing protein